MPNNEVLTEQDWDELLSKEPKTAGAPKQTGQERKDHDMQLWHAWNQGGRTREQLEPMMERFRPFVNSKVNSWSFPTVPKHVIETELWDHVTRAIHTYNPDRGAALSTHVINTAQGAVRLPTEHSSATYLPEGKSRKIAPILSAQNELRETYGREPTHAELSDYTGVSTKHVGKILKGMRKNTIGSTFDSDPTPISQPRHIEIIALMPDQIRHEIGDTAATVFEHMHGLNGREQITSPGAIARKMGKNPSQISRYVTRFQESYKTSAR